MLVIIIIIIINIKYGLITLRFMSPVWYMCLKTENCYLKTFMEIRVGEKSVLKCVKCCLKTENGCLKTQTKHPNGNFYRFDQKYISKW